MGRTGLPPSYPDHAGADGAAASSCARSSSANFRSSSARIRSSSAESFCSSDTIFSSPSRSFSSRYSRARADSSRVFRNLSNAVISASTFCADSSAAFNAASIRVCVFSASLYSSCFFINVSAAGVITSNSAVLLSISAVDNSTPSDTILTYSSASAVSSAVVAIARSSAALLQILPHSLIHALRLIGSFLLLQ
jgi:hypothetical protein